MRESESAKETFGEYKKVDKNGIKAILIDHLYGLRYVICLLTPLFRTIYAETT